MIRIIFTQCHGRRRGSSDCVNKGSSASGHLPSEGRFPSSCSWQGSDPLGGGHFHSHGLFLSGQLQRVDFDLVVLPNLTEKGEDRIANATESVSNGQDSRLPVSLPSLMDELMFRVSYVPNDVFRSRFQGKQWDLALWKSCRSGYFCSLAEVRGTPR